MDHIPQPLNSDRGRIIIPYLADEVPVYDGQGFADFPLRCGYSISEGGTTPINDDHHDGTSYCALLQSWLWFGLLQEVLQTAISRQDFIQLRIDGQKVLNTRSLLTCISETRIKCKYRSSWYEIRRLRNKQQDRDDLESPEELRVRALLGFAVRCCNEIDKSTDHENEDTGLFLLSIRVLIETLSGLFTNEDCLPTPSIRLDTCSLAPIRKRILSKSEWCRTHADHRTFCIVQPRLEAICRSVKSRPYTSLTYLSSLRRHELPWQTHALCEEIGACKAFDINEATFEGLHVKPDCTCKNVSAPRDQMLAILRDGGMPGVRYREKNNKGRLEYFRISSASRYIAISHLWSSGLGNLRSNDLPRCQLERLLRLLRKIKPFFDHLEFWLDIYCIPVVHNGVSDDRERKYATEMESLKQKALAWMPATYSWAYAVLVLDHEFACIPSGADAVEISTTVHASGWNSRYWTWQEHELARKIVYQVGDTSIVASELRNRILRAEAEVRESTPFLDRRNRRLARIRGDGSLWHSAPLGFEDVTEHSAGQKGSDFVSLWNTLTDRRTTKWQDALSIMGNLLGHRASQMAGMTPKDQIKALIKAQYTLPFDLLTIKAHRYGRGLDKQDCESRWILRSPVDSEPMRPHWLVLIRDDGLILRFHHTYSMTVLSFMSKEIISERKVFHWESRTSGSVSIVPVISSDADLDLEPLAEAVDHLLVLESLVLGEALSSKSGRGCLLRVVKRSLQTMHVTYCCPVTWKLEHTQSRASNERDRDSTVRGTKVIDMEEQAIKFDCDIASWPDLIDFKHTDVAESWSKVRRQTTRILTWFSLCVVLAAVTTMAVFMVTLQGTGVRPEMIYESGIVLTVVALSVVWTVLAIPIRFVEWVQGHLLFEFARPDYNPGLKKWQRLRRAIPSDKWVSMSWRTMVDTLWLYLAIGVVFLMEGIGASLDKATPRCLRRMPKSDSEVDGVSVRLSSG